MNIEYVGRGYEITDRDRNYAEAKLKKVLKFLDEPIDAHLTLEVQRHLHSAELHIHHRHGSLQARETVDEMIDAINLVIDTTEKQARRAKEKYVGRRRRNNRNNEKPHTQWPMDVVEAESVRSGGAPRIVKSSRIQIKPMSIDEAALKLDHSKNDFVVFRDAETDQVSVLYKRKDNNYGLIAPTG